MSKEKSGGTRQKAKSLFRRWTGNTEELVGEDAPIKPDCFDFAKEHPGVEGPVIVPFRAKRKEKNRRQKGYVDEGDGE
ncbi:hypothetical protein B6D29_01165 [Microgenomates bacterium UTCPR1]|nr:MAG: hypothetical protein B6D29_01165 [Microgenomates bacterium UTCPR1]